MPERHGVPIAKNKNDVLPCSSRINSLLMDGSQNVEKIIGKKFAGSGWRITFEALLEEGCCVGFGGVKVLGGGKFFFFCVWKRALHHLPLHSQFERGGLIGPEGQDQG
jgi:hypothetical protein